MGLVDKAFTYTVPHELVAGCKVGYQVSCEVGNIKRRGLVLEVQEVSEERTGLKPILSILENPFAPLLSPWQGILIQKLAHFYLSPMHKVVKTFVPEQIWSGNFSPKVLYTYRLSSELPVISPRARGLWSLIE